MFYTSRLCATLRSYDGPLLEEKVLLRAAEGGLSSPEYVDLCRWLASRLKPLCGLEESITSGPGESRPLITTKGSKIKDLKDSVLCRNLNTLLQMVYHKCEVERKGYVIYLIHKIRKMWHLFRHPFRKKTFFLKGTFTFN